ncbi:MAG: hydroxymethylbilane synthase [Acidimicrobiales bacterium]
MPHPLTGSEGTAGPEEATVPPRRAPSDPLRLATRGSPLARRQTELVAGWLQAAVAGLGIETVVVRTEGDRRAGESLDRIGGQGLFAAEVQRAVREGRADVAVHSAKDLPARTPPDMVLAAVPSRADARDALVGSTLAGLPTGGVVATGSARRRAQLANARPDLSFVDLRGNMATRAAKAEEAGVDAVVVAVAAFDRLGWRDRITDVLATEVCLPQVGQGALALECRDDDVATRAVLAAVDHAPAHRTLAAERAFLAAVGGSCSVPVGAWAELLGNGALRLHAMVASGDGRVLVRAHLPGDDPVALGTELARHLMEDRGGAAVLELEVEP